MISYDRKFVFIHIPKCGGTSIELALTDDSCVCKRNQWNQPARERELTPLNHFTFDQLRNSEYLDQERAKTFFKFAFVRNPWDRIISECFCPHISHIFSGCDSVKERIIKVASLSKDGYGGHCKAQYEFINSNQDIHIGRFENLQNDFNAVCQLIGLSAIPLNVHNKSNHEHYWEYYDDESENIVGQAHRQEIELLDYEFGA